MNFPIAFAFFAFAGIVLAGRDDLVYRYPKKPSWHPNLRNDEAENLRNILPESETVNKLDPKSLIPSTLAQNVPKDSQVNSLSEETLKGKITKKEKEGNGKSLLKDIIYDNENHEIDQSISSDDFYVDYPSDVAKKSEKKRLAKKRPGAPNDPIEDEIGAVVVGLDPEEQNSGEVDQETGLAPSYVEALQNFDAASDIIQRHFKREAFTYEETKDFRFMILAVVVDGLSKVVSEKGWNEYNTKYSDHVKSLAEQAALYPVDSVDKIRCVFRTASDNIQRIRSLINDKWTQSICKAQPFSCNTVIFTKVYSQSYLKTNKMLQNQAKLLIKLGEAAATYLKDFANVFEAVSNLDAYQYLANSKEVLRDLVRKNAAVRDLLFPGGGPKQEECNK